MAVVAGQHIGCIMFPSKAMLVQMRAQSHAHFRLEPLHILRKSVPQHMFKASCELCSSSLLIERCPCLRHLGKREPACSKRARVGVGACSGSPSAARLVPPPVSGERAGGRRRMAHSGERHHTSQRHPGSATAAQPAVFPCDPAAFIATYFQVSLFSSLSVMLML